jgi:hypothetical protein
MLINGTRINGGITVSPPPPPPGPTLQGSLSFNGTNQYIGMSPGFAPGSTVTFTSVPTGITVGVGITIG